MNETKKKKKKKKIDLFMNDISIYVYVYIYIERERELIIHFFVRSFVTICFVYRHRSKRGLFSEGIFLCFFFWKEYLYERGK